MTTPESPLPAADLAHVLTHTREIWEDLRGSRLFVTGGTGVFGTWLLESLAAADEAHGLGVRAVVLTRNPDAFLCRRPHLKGRAALDFCAGDVRSFKHPAGTFTHLIHAATTSSAQVQVEPGEMFETIMEGTRQALAFAQGAGVRKFLFVSSGAVYGRYPRTEQEIAEDDRTGPDPMDPGSAYDEGKRAAELMLPLARRADGLETKVARCFAFVGPMVPLNAHFAVGNFLRNGLAGEPIQVGGDGTPHRSYLHTADLMVWLWTILVAGRPGGPTTSAPTAGWRSPHWRGRSPTSSGPTSRSPVPRSPGNSPSTMSPRSNARAKSSGSTSGSNWTKRSDVPFDGSATATQHRLDPAS